MAARNLAILHASIYDAVNGIRGTYKPYFVTGMAPGGASIEAAAAAAYRVLVILYPAFRVSFRSITKKRSAEFRIVLKKPGESNGATP